MAHDETPDETDLGYDDEDDDDEEWVEKRCDCRCGECCRRLLIEVDLEDAEREPRIRDLGSPTYLPAVLTGTGQRELIGYLLNSQKQDGRCVFLDDATNLCTIHETRPLACRVFDCDGKGSREQLIELGILQRDSKAD